VPDDDSRLVERTLGGDHGAYGELVRRHQTVAFRVAYVVTGSAEEAEDATQDGFVKAYRALRRFRADQPFRPWLIAIVANEARNRVRRVSRRREVPLDLLPAAEAPSTEEAAIARVERESLLRAVARLPDLHRDALTCRYLVGLSEAETAAALGCPTGTVKSRVARGLDALRTGMEAQLS
jgi:RNA polymerase sigma-70 factor (ECF subfamily)